MPKTLNTATPASANLNPSLLALTPRQVLLANPGMTAAKPRTMTEQDKRLLMLSVAQYLQKNGFPKTLKKFKSEAQIEEDGWKGSKLDLEEMCLKFFDKGSNATLCSSGSDQDGEKKQTKEDSQNVFADQSDSADKPVPVKESTKEKKKSKRSSDSLEVECRELKPSEVKELNEVNKKKIDKKRKEKKSVPEPVGKEENKQIETIPEATEGKFEDLTTSEREDDASSQVEKKSKDKKKRKSKSISDEVANGVEEKDTNKSTSAKLTDGTEEETVASEIKKENKTQKRKRSESGENDSKLADKEPLEQSKRRKKENKEADVNEQKSEVKATSNGEVDLLESQKTPSRHLDGKENGNVKKTAEKSTTGKGPSKQRNGSAEPQSTTAKAFQRIKVDKVEFADDRLKDNSYWAKDGAEVGYGAKAQEVLGQVRGRDFRHEKTKKKRGSYRGGQIDLQSHSVKFNYSDEE